MDVLTLPEPGWALAYPHPCFDNAYLVHTACGWRTPEVRHADSVVGLRDQLMDGHRCRRGGDRR